MQRGGALCGGDEGRIKRIYVNCCPHTTGSEGKGGCAELRLFGGLMQETVLESSMCIFELFLTLK